MATELSGLVVTPLKLSSTQQKALASEDTHEVAEDIRAQIKTSMIAITTSRIITTFERRLEEGLGVKAAQFSAQDWHINADSLLQTAETVLENRHTKLLGEGGAILHDLDTNPARLEAVGGRATQATPLSGALLRPRPHRSSSMDAVGAVSHCSWIHLPST